MLIPLLAVAAGVVMLIARAATMPIPGHGDSSHYYSAARNLSEGRGLVVDYVWHFFSPPTTIPSPSWDYWMPLASVLSGATMWVFGTSTFVATIPVLLGSIGLIVVSYFLARHLQLSQRSALFVASLVAVFFPSLHSFGIIPEATVLWVAFANLALLLLVKATADDRLRWFALAGLVAGLAMLTRANGSLLIIPGVVAVLACKVPWRARASRLGLFVGSWVLTVSPLVVASYRRFGSPLPPASRRLLFIDNYEQLYAAEPLPTFSSWSSGGFGHFLKVLLDSRRDAVRNLVNSLSGNAIGLVVALTIISLIIGVIGRGLRLGRPWLIPLPFTICLPVFQVMAYPFSGPISLSRDVVGLMPKWFCCIVACLAAFELDRQWLRRVGPPLVAGLWICLLASGQMGAHALITENRQLEATLDKVGSSLTSLGAGPGSVVMTRDPFEVSLATGFSAIMIPDDPTESLLNTAHCFGADFLVLNEGQVALRIGLKDIDSGIDGLEFALDVPDSTFRIYRFTPAECT